MRCVLILNFVSVTDHMCVTTVFVSNIPCVWILAYISFKIARTFWLSDSDSWYGQQPNVGQYTCFHILETVLKTLVDSSSEKKRS